MRTISNALMNNPRGIAVTDTDELYIANETPARILVYASASTLNGNIAPTRVVTAAVLNTARDVFIDGAGRMFVQLTDLM